MTKSMSKHSRHDEKTSVKPTSPRPTRTRSFRSSADEPEDQDLAVLEAQSKQALKSMTRRQRQNLEDRAIHEGSISYDVTQLPAEPSRGQLNRLRSCELRRAQRDGIAANKRIKKIMHRAEKKQRLLESHAKGVRDPPSSSVADKKVNTREECSNLTDLT